MLRRAERILLWLALLFAIAVIVVALIEVDRRSEEEDVALQPTAVPSPTLAAPTQELGPLAPPGTATASPGETQPIPPPTATTAQPAGAEPAETAAPPPTPSPAPVVPTPTPRVSGAEEPMPVTGGGALPSGLTFVALGLALSYAARRAY